jgi:hypothetical protein
MAKYYLLAGWFSAHAILSNWEYALMEDELLQRFQQLQCGEDEF